LKEKILSEDKLIKIEFLFFCLLLVGGLVNIWSLDIYATLDGPAHLYNASLLNIYNQSYFLKAYYDINFFYLPNYLPQLLQKELLLLFNPFVAEKIFLSFIVILLPISFRYAVSFYSNKGKNFSFLIFSLVFSNLFNSGFYNFYFAFIFLNLQLVLLHFLLVRKNTLILFLFLCNTFLLYYSHPFVFIISVVTVILIAFMHYKFDFKTMIKTKLVLLFLYLPSFVLFYLFYFKINIPAQEESSDLDLTIFEKFSGIFNFYPGITFVYSEESIYAALTSVLFIILMTFVLIMRFSLNTGKNGVIKIDVFLLIAIVTIPFLFLTHNGILGGLFSLRLTFLYFYFLIFWICCNEIGSKFILLLSMIVIGFAYTNLSLIHHKYFKQIEYSCQEVYETGKHIQRKSVVMIKKFSNNYLFRHLSNYSGINNEIVLSENYEAILHWFPLKWKDKINHLSYINDSADKQTYLPDYVLIYGEPVQINNPENEEFKRFLSKSTFKIYKSKQGFCELYKVRN
jgi:hypothetical protein